MSDQTDTEELFAELRAATMELARRYPVVCIVMTETGPSISSSIPHEQIAALLEAVVYIVRNSSPTHKQLHPIKQRTPQ